MERSGSKSAPANPRVLGLLAKAELNAVDYYRIAMPYDVLIPQGYPMRYMPTQVANALAVAGQFHPELFDVFVLCRAAVPFDDDRILRFIDVLHQHGKKIIYETDDDYSNEHRHTVEGDVRSLIEKCDAVTVTTPYLAKRVGGAYVLPNYLDFGLWDRVERVDDGKVTIALAGTGTHFEDWKLVKEPLERLTQRDDVHLLMMGYKPYYLEHLPATFIPPAPYPTYAQSLGQVDIGLCPLVPDDQFNLAKSEIKALEFMAAGAAVIAQDMPVYRRSVSNRGNGLLASDDWYEKILLLVEDTQERRRLARSGWRWVRKHKDIRTHAKEWWRVYEEVYR